jgi:hypothetical protein
MPEVEVYGGSPSPDRRASFIDTARGVLMDADAASPAACPARLTSVATAVARLAPANGLSRRLTCSLREAVPIRRRRSSRRSYPVFYLSEIRPAERTHTGSS